MNTPRIIPMPQSIAWGEKPVEFDPADGPVVIHLSDAADPKEVLAADWLRSETARDFGRSDLFSIAASDSATAPGIHLTAGRPGFLDPGDLEALDNATAHGQGYVLRVVPERKQVWLVGSGPQGVLHAAATLLQLLTFADHRLRLPACHVRDWPDIPWRMAADWLLEAELRMWAYDWGDGRHNYVRRVKEQLDFCVRYKINGVAFDGYGWVAERFPGYSAMMRELNAYARARGIKLYFAGAGAGFLTGPMRPHRNIGRVHLNRKSYPNGEVYGCLGSWQKIPGMEKAGTCRSNEGLNRVRRDEIAEFVRSVEPGMLYIHHEDFGIFAETQESWRRRCPACRERWPNDDFAAADGGAGAIAHGYAATLEGILSVKNHDTGYDASRDCTIVFISPVYGIVRGAAPHVGMGGNPTANDWEKSLEHWANVLSLLPDHPNVQAGFRETWPHEKTGKRWVDAFKETMDARGLPSRLFMFFLGGADGYAIAGFNYPFVGTPAMNGIFEGVETMYNFSGACFQEPQQLLNAEFSWNLRAPGHIVPEGCAACNDRWKALMTLREKPEALFGADGFLSLACRALYGEEAGRHMAAFFTESVDHPREDGKQLVPELPARIFPLTIWWRILAYSRRWCEPYLSTPAEKAAFGDEREANAALQRRISRVWALYAQANTRGRKRVSDALAAPALKSTMRENLTRLEHVLEMGERFAEVLGRFHALLALSPESSEFVGELDTVESALAEFSLWLHEHFTFDTVCPLGGDQGSWLETLHLLRNRVELLRQGVSPAN